MLGFLNLFKPAGPTSTQFGARLRRMFATEDGSKLAVGHLGTLDPQAAGVLPVALGRATRLLPLIEDRRKAYAFTLVLGRATDTADGSGAVIAQAAVPDDIDRRLQAAVASFTGAIEQVPPMFSAVHHQGQRLHELARAGVSVERAKRAVTIYALTVLGRSGNTVRLRVACSEGTYVRTLCEDLAAACGTVGFMGALLREASGPFVLYESLTLDEVAANPLGSLVSPERVIPISPAGLVLDEQAGDFGFRAGRLVPLDAPSWRIGRVRARLGARCRSGRSRRRALFAPRKVFL